jgi:flagellar biosynthetic protein FlhB
VADNDQKTFDPTEKKLADARAKGDIPSSPEMKHAAMFAAAIVVVGGMGTYTVQQLGVIFVRLWGGADDYLFTPQGAENFAIGLLGAVGMAVAPLLSVLFAFALLGGVLQGRPSFALARLKPQWSKLNPFSGLGRMFGPRALIEFGKTLAKMTGVIVIATNVIWPKIIGLDQLVGADPAAITAAALGVVLAMIKAVAILVAALAIFDFVYQRWSFTNRMKMSLQEIKDEHKAQDGDPLIKGKIRQMQMQRARSRMMAAVPDASVIITNPTHYAVALKYDHGAMAAPVVVAKGVDAIALKIREVATAHGVPIVENVPLARALYASAELERPIPTEHYAAVAEIISYVLRLARGQQR